MFQINDDMSINVTRGDAITFSVTADEGGKAYTFKKGDVVRFKVTEKKDCEKVVLQKDFEISANTTQVMIYLAEEETRFGDVISKPTDYWYEVELNPNGNPQTILGYDDDGAKILKLYPEGKDIEWTPSEEDLGTIDEELDLTSERPVQNQAIARAISGLTEAVEIASVTALKIQATLRSIVNNEIEPILVETANNVVADATAKAKTSENNAKSYMNTAKTHADNSKAYSDMSKQYMENAYKTTPDGFAEVVEEVGRMDIKTSNDYTLPNSKKGGLRVKEVHGNTEQKTIAGNQLFDASKLPTKSSGGVTVTNNGDGSFTVSGSGKLTENFAQNYVISGNEAIRKLLKAGRLTFAQEVATQPYLHTYITDENGTRLCTASRNTSAEITNDILNRATQMVVLFYGASGTDIVSGTIKPMLYQDGDGTWEEYCGGTPSPNPNYPQPMYHTSDVVEMEIGGFSSAGVPTSATKVFRNKRRVPCKSGDVVKLDFPYAMYSTMYFFGENNVVLGTYAYSGLTTSHSVDAPSGSIGFDFACGGVEAIDMAKLGKITLTINGKYVNCIREHGKNFLNVKSLINALLSTSGQAEQNVTWFTSEFIDVRSLTDIVISSNGLVVRFAQYDRDKKFISNVSNILYSGITKWTTTLSENCAYIRVTIGNGSNLTLSEYLASYWVQIESGTVATPYEPYTETVAYFLTEKPMMADSHLFREDGLVKVEHGSAEEVLDGSDDEGWWTNVSGDNTRYRNSFVPKNRIKSVSNNAILGEILCTHYIKGTAEDTWFNKERIAVTTSNNVHIFDSNYTSSDNTAWKSHLAENPMTVKYPLATPYIEVLDTESQLALHSLKTFDNVTYIESGNRTKPGEIEVEYGTSQVGAYTLQSLNNSEANAVRLNELAVAMVSLGSEV